MRIRRKPILMGCAAVLLLAGLAGTLALLVRYEPEFYRQAAVPPGPQRKRHSGEFQNQFLNMLQRIKHDRNKWGVELTEEQINSWLAEDFLRLGFARNQGGIREPRVAILPDKLRLGLRYGQPPWSTIISIDLYAWLVTTEPNALALEVQNVQAGALPISGQSLLERVVDAIRRQDIDVAWYRRDGNPVALLRFQMDQRRPTIQLNRLVLQLQQGRILVGDPTGRPRPNAEAAAADITPSAN